MYTVLECANGTTAAETDLWLPGDREHPELRGLITKQHQETLESNG